MWCSGTWFSCRPGSARLVVGVGDVRGLFQPKWLWDFMVDSSFLQTVKDSWASTTQWRPDICFNSCCAISKPPDYSAVLTCHKEHVTRVTTHLPSAVKTGANNPLGIFALFLSLLTDLQHLGLQRALLVPSWLSYFWWYWKSFYYRLQHPLRSALYILSVSEFPVNI